MKDAYLACNNYKIKLRDIKEDPKSREMWQD